MSSTSSANVPSPTTPTFSLRGGHSRFPSSTSSLASSPTMRESMDGFGAGKTPLTGVKEEPLEREDDFEIVHGDDDNLDYPGKLASCAHVWKNWGGGIAPVTIAIDIKAGNVFMNALDTNLSRVGDGGLPSPIDYDLADDAHMDTESTLNLAIKRQRGGDPNITTMTSRFGSRLPSISRKWRHKRAGNPKAMDDSSPEPRLSRANSTRASSLAGSCIELPESQDPQLPPTPARSVFNDDADDSHPSAIDIQKANAPGDGEDHEAKASTPLLPPIMAQFPLHIQDVPVQSPLQSPTVAQSPTSTDYESTFSVNSPVHTPQHPGLPSPPLSTKPSISSFHRQRGMSQLLPSSEIPPMLITEHNDEWSNKLGHANYTIVPKPYIPDQFNPKACKKLCSEWDRARCNYMKHLMRTGEHYGATSKIYRLTEEKWAAIDALWKRNSDLCISRTVENGFEVGRALSQSSVAEPTPLMKLPSISGPRSEGKFPPLGDDNIVGPMEQIASQLQQRRPSRKAGFLKFLHGVIPSGAGVFTRGPQSRSTSPY